ncbi:MAG: transcription antitermination factor NusB [Anaerolineae bacterium]
MKVRRRARIVAMQALFEIDMTDHEPAAVLRERFGENELPPEGEAFATLLVNGTLQRQAEIDALIERVAPEWPIDQIAGVDRAILRLATFELLFGTDVAPKVAINEAVELAKTFGSDSSRRFVNGALGALVAQLPALSTAGATERRK